jgi:phage-related protein
MGTINDSIGFFYDGEYSEDYGIKNVMIGSGMYDEQFVSGIAINETSVKGSDEPMFHSLDESPREFEMYLAFDKGFDNFKLDNIIRWLYKGYYRPMSMKNSPDKIMHCMPVGDSRIVHNGLKEGYLQITMRTKSSKFESPLVITEPYDLSTNVNGYTISIMNDGHTSVYPELSIKKIGIGNITITKDSEIFEIRDLTDQEDIYINSEKEMIETDIVGVYRYDNIIGDFHDLEMKVGNNDFFIEGTCEITFRYREKYRF